MTERELLLEQPKRLYKVSQLIQRGDLDFDDLSELIPGILHINSAEDLAINYLSREGLNLFQYELEELQRMGFGALLKHQSSYTTQVTFPRLGAEMAKGDPHKVLPFFQDWQTSKDSEPMWFFSTVRRLNDHQHICISVIPGQLDKFVTQMNQVTDLSKSFDRYFAAFNALTKREKEILQLLGKDLSRKEISSLLFISEKTVKKHCENIFFKLGTNKRVEIARISNAFFG